MAGGNRCPLSFWRQRPFVLMKNGFFLFLLTAFSASLALSQSAATGSTKPAQSSSAAAGHASAPKKAKPAKRKTSTAAAGSSFRPRQSGPTPERYREIQQALVDKGYLKSEPDGVWDAQSADALRQFQTDQKLTPTGKISAASLIGLGLGPKDSESSSSAAAPADPPPPR
jgi:peptidoglycan hydrolase-like protein with peptidoglycan-binding domain